MVPVCRVKRNQPVHRATRHYQYKRTKGIQRMTKGIISLGRTDLGSNLFNSGQEVYETRAK